MTPYEGLHALERSTPAAVTMPHEQEAKVLEYNVCVREVNPHDRHQTQNASAMLEARPFHALH